MFRDLVIARVVEPTSLLDADRVLAELGRVSASLSTRKRTLRRCVRRELPRPDRRACFAHAAGQRGRLAGAVRRDDAVLRGREGGRAAQGRLLQGTPGRPADRGRAAGRPARVPAGDRLLRGKQGRERHDPADHQAFQARHGIERHGRRRRRRDAVRRRTWPTSTRPGCRFIVGSRVTKAPIDLESHFRWHGDAFTDGQVIDTLTPQDRRRNTRQRPGPAGRTGLGPRRAPRVVAGGVGLLRQARRPRHQDPDRCRRTGPATSSPARRPPARPGSSRPPTEPARAGRGLARPGPAAGRAEGLRHQHPAQP